MLFRRLALRTQQPAEARTTLAAALAVALAAVCAIERPAHADEGRFHDFAVGARAAALGGAFGAIADDATGVFYNPAGLVDVRTARVNLSTSLFGLELVGSSLVENDLVRRGLSAADLIFVPSSTGYVDGLGPAMPSGWWQDALAFATLVPEYSARFTEQIPADPRATRFRSASTDRRLLFGLAWAHRAGPWLRLGIAGHYALRALESEDALTSGDVGAPGAFIDAATHLRMSSHGVRAALGAKLWLGPRVTLGATLTTPSLSLWRDVAFEHVVATSAGDGNAPTLTVDRVRSAGPELQSDIPGSLRLAIAFTEPGRFTIAADVTGHLGSTYDVFSAALLEDGVAARVPVSLRVERGPVANVAIGLESLVTDGLSVAVGAFTNLTSAPRLTLDDAGALKPDSSRLSHVHMFGGALSLGFHGAFDVTRVGLTGSAGAGDVVQPLAPDVRFLDGAPPLRAMRATQALVYLFLGSTFRIGEESSARDYAQ